VPRPSRRRRSSCRDATNERNRRALLGPALILASVGIYGVVAYSVTQRTRELGLRMAIGAQQRDCVAMVLRESLVVVAVGMAVGVAAAFTLP
jgi:ABC-type antimicrobial peptide transport system permease subunit